MDIADTCTRLRDLITVIDTDLPSLRTQASPSDQLASHIIDRVLVARDNAFGCVILAEHGLAAPLASANRSIFESLLASYWASQNEKNANILLDSMLRELMRLMRLNLTRGHAVIRDKQTGDIHTQEVLNDPKMAEAGRPLSFRMMANNADLSKLYDTSYGFMSMLAHGTATELLANPDQHRELISSQLHSVLAFLKCIYLIANNRIRESRATEVRELEGILKISLSNT